jgi:uncharacterized membrane protein YozB (DUF420 family)
MLSLSDLPLLNAILNSTSVVLLTLGYISIRKKKVSRHKALMISAVTVSLLFLTSYLIYHFNVGSVRYTGVGASRTIYFSILTTHTILAATLPLLVSITLVRALKSRFDRHRKIARITLPIWFYVSVTGVIIYLMLYTLS